jgi:hypothetical protein
MEDGDIICEGYFLPWMHDGIRGQDSQKIFLNQGRCLKHKKSSNRQSGWKKVVHL